jgi:hypothetical protein
MTEMRRIINRDTANIHPDFTRLERHEFFLFAAQGIEDFEGHLREVIYLTDHGAISQARNQLRVAKEGEKAYTKKP